MKKKNKQQEAIDSNTPLYDVLDFRYQRAIDMRLSFGSYEQIAAITEVAEQSVRRWFMKGGICHNAYLEKKAIIDAEYKEEFDKIQELIKRGAVDGIFTLLDMAKRRSMSGVVAARDLLDRAGFKPVEKTEGTLAVKTDEPLVDKALKLINENYPSTN